MSRGVLDIVWAGKAGDELCACPSRGRLHAGRGLLEAQQGLLQSFRKAHLTQAGGWDQVPVGECGGRLGWLQQLGGQLGCER